jgi:hypothetical protein
MEPLIADMRTAPDLAYNRLRNEFLVVWAQDFIGKYNIRGQRVGMSGGAGPLGSAFWISPWDADEDWNPDVAAVPRSPDGQYLVAWQYFYSATDYDIWTQRVAGGGTLEGSAFVVYDSPWYDVGPAVAGSESNQQYLVAWTMTSAGYPCTYGRVVRTSGALVDSATAVGGVDAYKAAVAAGPTGDFLIAIQDKFAGNFDIFGRLWGNRLYLPLVLRSY